MACKTEENSSDNPPSYPPDNHQMLSSGGEEVLLDSNKQKVFNVLQPNLEFTLCSNARLLCSKTV